MFGNGVGGKLGMSACCSYDPCACCVPVLFARVALYTAACLPRNVSQRVLDSMNCRRGRRAFIPPFRCGRVDRRRCFAPRARCGRVTVTCNPGLAMGPAPSQLILSNDMRYPLNKYRVRCADLHLKSESKSPPFVRISCVDSRAMFILDSGFWMARVPRSLREPCVRSPCDWPSERVFALHVASSVLLGLRLLTLVTVTLIP